MELGRPVRATALVQTIHRLECVTVGPGSSSVVINAGLDEGSEGEAGEYRMPPRGAGVLVTGKEWAGGRGSR